MLRPLRRLRYLLLPLYATALLAFVARLGWAHDPTCPHHAGHAGPDAAHPTAHLRAAPASHAASVSHAAHAADVSNAAHASHASHAAHVAQATAAEPAPTTANTLAPADSSQPPGGTDCRCLDPTCCLSGVVAVLDADTGNLLAGDAPVFDAWLRPPQVSVVHPGAYSSHRLPYPHAPPCIDGLT